MVGGMVGVSQAALVTLVDQGALWEYAMITEDLMPQWDSLTHSSFDWDGAAWSSGNAAFGNMNTFSMLNTYWSSFGDLALQKSFTIDGALAGPLTLNVAIDQGFVLFVNGTQEAARAYDDNFTNYWEYTFSLPSEYFHAGNNIIQVLAEGSGWTRYFDLALTADVNPAIPVDAVPEPATLLLLGSGLLGMIGFGKKKFQR